MEKLHNSKAACGTAGRACRAILQQLSMYVRSGKRTGNVPFVRHALIAPAHRYHHSPLEPMSTSGLQCCSLLSTPRTKKWTSRYPQ